MILGVDPKVDYAFKRVFGSPTNRDILLDTVRAVLTGVRDPRVADLEISNPFNEKDYSDDKLSVVDIKARDPEGRQFHVEMQTLAAEVFPQRLLYYWARVYQEQLKEKGEYATLKATVSICFVNGVLFPETPQWHQGFYLFEPTTNLVLTDHLAIHVIELPKFNRALDELRSPLDAWCWFLRHAATLDSEHFPVQLVSSPPMRHALEVLTMISQTDIERERYEARLKKQRDDAMFLDHARKTGLREGLQQGELIGRIHFCQRLLKQPLTPKEELLPLSVEQLTSTADELEKKIDSVVR